MNVATLKTRSLADMWVLTNQNRAAALPLSHFSPYLIIAMMWEESAFQNIRQMHGKGNAYGFGQVEAMNIDTINQTYNVRFHAATLDKDDPKSVELVSYALLLAYEQPSHKKDPVKTLNVYATGNPNLPAGVISNWKKCEALLKTIPSLIAGSSITPVLTSNEKAVAEKALLLARSNNGPLALRMALP